MRLNIDLGKEDLEELLATNVNYRCIRRLLPIIKVVAPELCKKYAIKWRYVMQEFGKERTPAFTYDRDLDIRYPGDNEAEENGRKKKIAAIKQLVQERASDVNPDMVDFCDELASVLNLNLNRSRP